MNSQKTIKIQVLLKARRSMNLQRSNKKSGSKHPVATRLGTTWALALFLVLTASSSTFAAQKTYVLVHGAWGGGWDWRTIADGLQAEGHRVYRATLTGLGERAHLASPEVNLTTHIRDVTAILDFEDLEEVILVGHSYGGIVITGAASASSRVAHLIYIDALLLEDGESMWSLQSGARQASLMEMAESKGEGWNIPPYWPDPGKDRPHPLATFMEALEVNPGTMERVGGTYILTREPGAADDTFSRYSQRAAELGYRTHVLETGHNPQRSMPGELTALLLGAVR